MRILIILFLIFISCKTEIRNKKVDFLEQYVKNTLLLTFFISVSSATYSQEFTNEDRNIVEKLITQKISKDNIPGLSISIVKDGKLVWSNGYGTDDVENFVPAKATTAYRSASIGKPITAIAIKQLMEQGKIDLDKPKQHFYSSFPKKNIEKGLFEK